nr:MAG TPA: hypothetical protein [Caudoviricetes sp.]DAY42224.1 MAG TPA: hypothetical protein [Caudoviricetes sp.]
MVFSSCIISIVSKPLIVPSFAIVFIFSIFSISKYNTVGIDFYNVVTILFSLIKCSINLFVKALEISENPLLILICRVLKQ